MSLYPDYDEDRYLLSKAVKLAGEKALSYFGKTVKSWMKQEQSPVSEADLAIDEFLKEFLLKARPDYGWISEESSPKLPEEGCQRYFIVDPIDGTRGFLNKNDIWCISIAVVENGSPKAGVLYAPRLEAFFEASYAHGAYFNGQRVIRKQEKNTGFAIIAPRDFLESLPQDFYQKLIIKERLPSLAYSLALFAKNELDFLLTPKRCFDWDIAAADILLKEAGQELLDIHSQRPYYGDDPYRQNYLCLAPKDQQINFAHLAKSHYKLS